MLYLKFFLLSNFTINRFGIDEIQLIFSVFLHNVRAVKQFFLVAINYYEIPVEIDFFTAIIAM